MAKGVMRSTKTRDGIAAMLADNIGYLEEDMWDIQQEWLTQHATFDDMQDALEQAGLRVLNRPNLIKQNWYTNRNMPTSEVIAHTITVPIEDATAAAAVITDTCTNANITSSYVIHAVKSSDYNVVWGSMVTATFSSGSASISIAARPDAHNAAVTVTVYLCTVAATNVLYGEVSKCSGSTYPYMKSIGSSDYPGHDTGDGVVCSVVDLAAADQITETDGESYTKAIQCAITAKSAYGNTEYLMYYNPYFYRTYTQGATSIRNYGQIEEMEPGNTYSMSCWVRVLSGDGVWLKMGYGNSYTNDPYNDTTNHRSGVSDFIKVDPNGGVWQRISWTFEFNPTGNWYTETSATSNGVTTVTRSYNWFKKICFGICRKFNATVQICGFRLVRGKTYICETYDDLDEDLDATKGRVTALETASAAVPGAIAAAKSAMLSIMAESDTATATAPHAVGELITVGDVLYRVTSAIATGETIAAGTNVTATTLAAEIAAAKTCAAAAAQSMIVDFGTLSARNYYGVGFTVPGIDSSYKAVDVHVSPPQNLSGQLSISSGNGSVILYANLTGATALKIYFVKFGSTVSATEQEEEEIIE